MIPKFLSLALSLSFWSGVTAASTLELGKSPPDLVLKAPAGGLVKDGSPWDSASLKGKVHMLVYVDPDLGDLNAALTKAIKDENFDEKYFQSVAIINMQATWKPNAIIGAALASKQKEFPRTTYVKDYEKYLVKSWDLADESFDVLLFNPKGELLFHKSGLLKEPDISQFIGLIKQEAQLIAQSANHEPQP